MIDVATSVEIARPVREVFAFVADQTNAPQCIEFRPTLQAQHDDAANKGQHHRATLFNQLLTGITEGEAS